MYNFKQYIYIVAIAMLTVAGCTKDLDPEVTSLDLSRLLSPTGLTAVVNKVSVTLTWAAVPKAETYVIELFDNAGFAGTPTKTIKDITFEQVPYTIPALDGETNYYVRVKAAGKDIPESRWVTATFKTAPEQILKPIDPEELDATQVILRWTPGEAASSIVVNPGNITHTVTPAEVTAGAATVTGLTGETAYTATLLRNTKVRGTLAFTTLLDLTTTIVVHPGDDLATLVQNAADGAVFGLLAGTYNTQDIVVSKSISIKGARPDHKPVLTGTIFRISNGAGLVLKDLALNGTGSKDGNQAIVYDADMTTPYNALTVENCTINNYTKGLVYVNKKALISAVTFKGNIISAIECNSGDFVDFRAGLAQTFLFTNNTVYNSAAARDLFRMDAGGSTNFPSATSIISIQNNTFNNNLNTATNRYLYIRLTTCEITFSKNIIANSLGIYSNQAITNTNLKALDKNNYFQAPTMLSAPGTTGGGTNSTSLDPGFANAAAGNFTISNATLKQGGIGDPRWIQ